ncbi:hypothetical protein QLX08_005800 [Tetragonisca angustula]|uniref:Methyltransferase FkbM domain-containing protein n=1 Tax=Tetragonisca angustula TaxID=166442 RepID=A0AAW0ZWT1_9HYME
MSCIVSFLRGCICIWKKCYDKKWYLVIALLVIGLIILILQLVIMFYLSLTQEAPDGFEEVKPEVLNRWYNFTNGTGWYNNEIQSPDTKNWQRYLNEIRKYWIIRRFDPRKSYNLQNPEVEDQSMGQTRIIRTILKDMRSGFFVECGAYDGETRSNTLALEQFFGWRGLLIEADPLNFSNMMDKNRNAYLTATCLSIKPYPSLSTFLMAKNVGRLHDVHDPDGHLPNSPDVAHNGVHISVQCFPFIDLMAALNVTTVNYFSLDIEGYELQVLKTIPFDKIDIETLSVEFSHIKDGEKELIDFMSSKGYHAHSFVIRPNNLANDVIFVKQSLMNRL